PIKKEGKTFLVETLVRGRTFIEEKGVAEESGATYIWRLVVIFEPPGGPRDQRVLKT
ncbi:hypothetical protein MRX96_029207, partial [Rhipicephalus microplus]